MMNFLLEAAMPDASAYLSFVPLLLLIVLSLTGVGGYAINRGISHVWLLLYDLIY